MAVRSHQGGKTMELGQVDAPRMSVAAVRVCLRNTCPQQLYRNLGNRYGIARLPDVPSTVAIEQKRRISSGSGTGTTIRTCHPSE